MAYRLPHVVSSWLSLLLLSVSSRILVRFPSEVLMPQVMGDRSGNIRWWDVTTGLSSSFNTYRDGIRRIKFTPVVSGDRTRGRIAVLFNDHTFSVYDLVSNKKTVSPCSSVSADVFPTYTAHIGSNFQRAGYAGSTGQCSAAATVPGDPCSGTRLAADTVPQE